MTIPEKKVKWNGKFGHAIIDSGSIDWIKILKWKNRKEWVETSSSWN